jgi:hypothetical protein
VTDAVGTDEYARTPAMRVDRITPHDLVKIRVKDRVIYGEVLDIADGVVRFRPLCPAAGWHSATARQVVGHWRKVGRRGEGQRDGREPPSTTAEQLPLPETES